MTNSFDNSIEIRIDSFDGIQYCQVSSRAMPEIVEFGECVENAIDRLKERIKAECVVFTTPFSL